MKNVSQKNIFEKIFCRKKFFFNVLQKKDFENVLLKKISLDLQSYSKNKI